MPNENLTRARNARNDEFYTQREDIEKEVSAYKSNTFRDKTVLLPCDDQEWSHFTNYFALHLPIKDFGLKKLISIGYAPDSKRLETPQEPTDFEKKSPQFDPKKTRTHGKIFVIDPNTGIDLKNWQYLDGDGDFRSDEVKALRDEADIIVTNPPFSLFREFLAWIMEAEKKFLILGNMNAITYKEVFPLIKENKVWLGKNFGSQDFMVPVDFEQNNTYFRSDGKKFAKFGNICWFTNLVHGKRYDPLTLMTMAENLKFSKHKEIKGKTGYDHYDNYDAIDVPFVDAIPSDYNGVMGVPISFIGKYCPEQFEIIGATESEGKGFSNGLFNGGNVKQALINGCKVFKRIFIRKKQ